MWVKGMKCTKSDWLKGCRRSILAFIVDTTTRAFTVSCNSAFSPLMKSPYHFTYRVFRDNSKTNRIEVIGQNTTVHLINNSTYSLYFSEYEFLSKVVSFGKVEHKYFDSLCKKEQRRIKLSEVGRDNVWQNLSAYCVAELGFVWMQCTETTFCKLKILSSAWWKDRRGKNASAPFRRSIWWTHGVGSIKPHKWKTLLWLTQVKKPDQPSNLVVFLIKLGCYYENNDLLQWTREWKAKEAVN